MRNFGEVLRRLHKKVLNEVPYSTFAYSYAADKTKGGVKNPQADIFGNDCVYQAAVFGKLVKEILGTDVTYREQQKVGNDGKIVNGPHVIPEVQDDTHRYWSEFSYPAQLPAAFPLDTETAQTIRVPTYPSRLNQHLEFKYQPSEKDPKLTIGIPDAKDLEFPLNRSIELEGDVPFDRYLAEHGDLEELMLSFVDRTGELLQISYETTYGVWHAGPERLRSNDLEEPEQTQANISRIAAALGTSYQILLKHMQGAVALLYANRPDIKQKYEDRRNELAETKEYIGECLNRGQSPYDIISALTADFPSRYAEALVIKALQSKGIFVDL